MATSVDRRLTAARNFLAIAPESDFSRLLAGVVDLLDDYMDAFPDETTIITNGGIYFAPADVHRLPGELVESFFQLDLIHEANRVAPDWAGGYVEPVIALVRKHEDT